MLSYKIIEVLDDSQSVHFSVHGQPHVKLPHLSELPVLAVLDFFVWLIDGPKVVLLHFGHVAPENISDDIKSPR